MVLSAELYGSQQLEDLDHSGPLLVMCAACERELNLRVFSRVVSKFPEEKRDDGGHVVDTHATLGGAIETLHKGRRLAAAWANGEDDAEQRILGTITDPDFARAALLTGRFLSGSSTDLQEIANLVKRLRSLNVKFRRPSAHDEVVEAGVWSEGRPACSWRTRDPQPSRRIAAVTAEASIWRGGRPQPSLPQEFSAAHPGQTSQHFDLAWGT